MFMSIPVADLPSWISAISSVGALLAAIAAGIIAGRIYSMERRRDRADVNEQRQVQARNISGWIELETSLHTGNTQVPTVKLCNKSDMPVYRIRTFLTRPGMEAIELELIKVLPPSRELYSLPVTAASDNHELGIIDGIDVSFAFVDAFGIQWYRDESGRLGEIVEESNRLEKTSEPNYPLLDKSS